MHALAIIPFLQTQAELDGMDLDQIQVRYIFRFVLSFMLNFWDRDSIPFSPSFILDLPAKVDPQRHQLVFLRWSHRQLWNFQQYRYRRACLGHLHLVIVKGLPPMYYGLNLVFLL